jgi:Rrf2 family protein
MRITRETDYAIRCILYLSRRPTENVIVSEIADAMEIPASFLPKIVQRLVKGGLLQSVKGVKGGIRLSRDPEAISLFDVIEVIEGPLALNVCTGADHPCTRSAACTVRPAWAEIQGILEEQLKTFNFQGFFMQDKVNASQQ